MQIKIVKRYTLPKSESEKLESLKQAAREIKKTQKLNVREAIKKDTYSFISKRRLSAQEESL